MKLSNILIMSALFSATTMMAYANVASCPSITFANQAVAAYEDNATAGQPVLPPGDYINFQGWRVYIGLMPNAPSLKPGVINIFVGADWNNDFSNTMTCHYFSQNFTTILLLTKPNMTTNPQPSNPNNWSNGQGNYGAMSACSDDTTTNPAEKCWWTEQAN
jgi:hypothetical protein